MKEEKKAPKNSKTKKSDNLLYKVVEPILPEFKLKDVLQIVIGSSILAIPVGFTEEAWTLGLNLPILNIFVLLGISIIFIAFFTYYHYHRNGFSKYHRHFTTRVISTYMISFLVVGILLTLIQKAPWTTDWIVAFKRIVIVAFPASMSGTIADMIK